MGMDPGHRSRYPDVVADFDIGERWQNGKQDYLI